MKTALLGLGRMGTRHAAVIRNCGLSISAVADINAETAAKVGAELGVAPENCFTLPDELIRKVRPELLIIATTAPSHHTLVLEAAANGVRAILCEKPMGTSLAECEEMIEACGSAGVRLAINHQMRFMQHYIEPKKKVFSQEFGGLTSIIVSAGNFGIAMNGTHYFEMFRFLTDEEPVKVSAWFDSEEVPNPRGPQFKDSAGCIRLETESGKRFYMDASADQGQGLHVTYNCRNGRISVDELSGKIDHAVRTPDSRSAPTTRYGMPFDVGTSQIAPTDAIAPTEATLRALLDGDNYPTGEHGLLAMKLLVASHLSSSRGGQTIDLRNEVLPRDLKLPIA